MNQTIQSIQNSYNNISAIEVISEFMVPVDDNINLIIIADDQNTDFNTDMVEAFNYTRKLYKTPGSIQPLEFTTYQLFKGRITPHLNKNCITFCNADISKSIMKVLINEPEQIDPLDAMLLSRFIEQYPGEKFIFDISYVPDRDLQQFAWYMDENSNNFNYLVADNLLGVWILNADMFKL